jgi:putative methanogen marker protein 4
MAKDRNLNLGIGLGDSEYHNQKILKVSLNFLKEYNSNIFIFGTKTSLNNLLGQFPNNKTKSRVKSVECQEPENYIFNFLKSNSIQAIIRGSLSSNKFLKNLKTNLLVKGINRLALLETYDGQEFFYGPVGIDECNSLESKIIFLEAAIKQMRNLDINPKISILSGGRINDIGRDDNVDKSIKDAEKIVDLMKKKYPKLTISHDEILIEKAIENKSNLIVAPDGVSGNLIYRTLVHLGAGKAYGAIYMGVPKTIIDTSRVGSQSEIYGALILALALSKS